MSETDTKTEMLGLSLHELRGAAAVPALRPGTFNLEFYHAMQARDEALIADEILHGTISKAYTYSIRGNNGEKIEGVSVVGARQLMHEAGGIKVEILGSISKRGPQMVFTSYPYDGHPFSVTISSLDEVASDPDFYTVLMRATDIKKGNTVPIEVTEMRYELRRGSKTDYYERRHVEKIAQAKGLRNGVLALTDQFVVEAFKKKSLESHTTLDLTESVVDARRNAVIGYAVRIGVAINREKLMTMAMAQLDGLSAAAAENSQEVFVRALAVLGISGRMTDVDAPGAAPAAAAPGPKRTAAPRRTALPAQASNEPPPPDAGDPGAGGDEAPGVEEPPHEEPPPRREAAPPPAKQRSGLFDDGDGFSGTD